MSLFNKKVSSEQQKIVDNLRKVLGDKDFNLLEGLIEEELKNPPKVAPLNICKTKTLRTNQMCIQDNNRTLLLWGPIFAVYCVSL